MCSVCVIIHVVGVYIITDIIKIALAFWIADVFHLSIIHTHTQTNIYSLDFYSVINLTNDVKSLAGHIK